MRVHYLIAIVLSLLVAPTHVNADMSVKYPLVQEEDTETLDYAFDENDFPEYFDYYSQPDEYYKSYWNHPEYYYHPGIHGWHGWSYGSHWNHGYQGHGHHHWHDGHHHGHTHHHTGHHHGHHGHHGHGHHK